MTDRRRGLGRGLGALIPTRTSGERASSPSYDEVEHRPDDRRSDAGAGRAVNGVDIHEATSENDAPRLAYFAEIPLGAIRTNPRQPRQVFDEDTLAELAHSIREVGVLQPIVVRELPDPSPDNVEAGGDRSANYELVMGERRMRAAQSAGLATIPAIVRETKDDALLRDALLENLHRAQLNPLEEAAAYDQMLADFGCTQDELALKIGKSRPQISNTLRLLRLPPEVQRRIAAGVLSAGHARALLGLDSAAQERMAQRVVAEGLSVRTVEELVALGDLGTPDRAPRRQHAPVAPALTELGTRLSERFETRVKVDLGRRKGKITIEFASIADLERIVAVMDPEPEARAHARLG